MKTRLLRAFLAFALLAAILFCAPFVHAEEPAESAPAAAEITLEPEEVRVGKGMTVKVALSYDTETFPKKHQAAWETSDKTVATVRNGTVRGISPGTAEITCTVTFPDGTAGTKTLPVTVYLPVRSVKAKPAMTLAAGETGKPEVEILPEDAAYPGMVWASSDETVAVVDAEGSITAVAGGKAVITGTLQEPGVDKQKSVRIQLTVTQSVSAVSISATDLTISKGKSEKVDAEVLPATATNRKLKWSSSDPKVATAAGGTISARGTGTCVITAEAADGSGAAASVTVRVVQAVTGIRFGKPREVIFAGDTFSPDIIVTPEDATDRSMTWVSDNPSVATVSSSGRVTARGAGTAVITATAKDGSGKSAGCTLVVEPSCPVTVTSIATYFYIDQDENCLVVTPYNRCSVKTVAAFRFSVSCYNAGGKLLEVYPCEWSGGGFRSFGPGQYGQCGTWHWRDLYYCLYGSYEKITVESVTFTDGTVREIPPADRMTTLFN